MVRETDHSDVNRQTASRASFARRIGWACVAAGGFGLFVCFVGLFKPSEFWWPPPEPEPDPDSPARMMTLNDMRWTEIHAVETTAWGGELLVGGAVGGRRVDAWSTQSAKHKYSLGTHPSPPTVIAISSNDERVVIGSRDGSVQGWRLGDQTRLFTLDLSDSDLGKRGQTVKRELRDVAISPEGRQFAVAFDDGTVEVWRFDPLEKLYSCNKHTGPVQSVEFLGGAMLVSGSADGSVRLWNKNQQIKVIATANSLAVTDVAVSRNGNMIAFATDDGGVNLLKRGDDQKWQASDLQEATIGNKTAGVVPRVEFSPDNTRLAAISADNVIRVWTVADGKGKFALKGAAFPLQDFAFTFHTTRITAVGFTGGDAEILPKGDIDTWPLVSQSDNPTEKGGFQVLEPQPYLSPNLYR
ncbi:MAG: hypothetical protein N2C14_10185 [Planctomycetales bacterium]